MPYLCGLWRFANAYDLNEKRGIKEKYKDDFTIGEDGVPVFKAGRKMITMALKFQKHE